MKEMRPLLLPRLVASRKTDSVLSTNSTDAPSCESLTATSDCSTPPTPTFSTRGHARHPSSNSSLGSSPPTQDPVESLMSSVKLPKLTEEPHEKEHTEETETDMDMLENEDFGTMCYCGVPDCAHQTYSLANSPAMSKTGVDDFSDCYFSDEADFTAVRVSKRRRSEDSPVNSISTRIGGRLPSLSRRWKDRHAGSNLSLQTGSLSRSRAPSIERTFSSLNHSARQSREHVASGYPLTPSQSFVEISEDAGQASPIDIVTQVIETNEEPIDREGLASTPLLPPTFMNMRVPENTPMQSPLQSPTIAESTGHLSFPHSPAAYARCMSNQAPTPPLSTRPSYSSLVAARSGPNLSSTDIPRSVVHDINEQEWAADLGHANFTIYPEPYLPEICDSYACRQLFSDWEAARHSFMKHQVRTGEHVGVTSTTYKLTQQKWAEIDAQWKKFHDLALTTAGFADDQFTELSPVEPAPLVKLPSLNSKFPGKGDEDIVGPMTQVAAQIQPRQSRTASFTKFFSDFKLSNPFFGKSSSAANR